MKKELIWSLLLLLTGTYMKAQEPIQHFNFDDIKVERQKANLERGETYVPKEVFAYVKEASGKEHSLNGKYYKSVPGVKGNAILLDGYTSHIVIEEEFDEGIDDFARDQLKAFTIKSWVALGPTQRISVQFTATEDPFQMALIKVTV
ncbi:hypothetical protein [Flagellimonas sp. CMM7]|uniref:hypothetical protein n=1 Tax=Flagellimonas sp. CMM7 TaxID=2654676 RepID=UPI001F1C7314|nr:hypothetical protein [Flagellimonas sp. CMM7]UII79869.1 hypothetical protein LV704_19695 [Flagellimonas sp. CMM7]